MLQPASTLADRDLIDLRVREHLAFDAMCTWQAHRPELRAQLVSAAVARELAALGYGGDELAGLDAADAALRTLKALPPGAIGLATPAAARPAGTA